MGYRSDFILSINDEPEGFDHDEFFNELDVITGYKWNDDALYDCKWYDCENDLGQLSKMHPDVKISVHCAGEDGAQWMIYAFNGQVERCDGTMEFEPRTLWPEDDTEEPMTILDPDNDIARLRRRDDNARAALNGMLAHSTRYVPRKGAPVDWHDAIAEEAYEIADAMERVRISREGTY